ncbi:cytochrome c oxidase subunit I [Pseudoduganella armeniaca]|uniref:Cytochrome c oxidase subunit I n=1 Tax=Pseudoduganella armeniaca TaxID=2072590 RepID=A0A2R4CDQ3_9BURK|nr:cytochrome c oxidase subunit I [Pseudoduganella armeniaca]AVR97600.1 cytochrome c oxidase subunit I [Pseudoduganella armeniaca]
MGQDNDNGTGDTAGGRHEEAARQHVDAAATDVADVADADATGGHEHAPRSFAARYIWSQDHKVIAVQYTLTALVVGVIGIVLSDLMRLQLGFPGKFAFIDPVGYYQYITMHGMIMVIYLLTAIFLGGFGNYLIPLMVGARDMVFPYLNMLSYWFYLLAVLILVASFFVPGGPTGAGWTLYPPQAILPGTPGVESGIVVMLVSLLVFIAAATMGGLNYVTTVLQARTRGMTLMRMPLTVWGIFVATILALLAFPALFVSGVMMLLDRVLGTSFFMPALVSMGQATGYSGGSPLLFQHLFWFFGHPEVYIVALPAFGIISDLISVHARKCIFGYRMMVWAIVVIGALSFVVWAHHMYVSGMHPLLGFFFAVTTLVIAVPTALKVYNWTLTLWRGDIHMTVPMLFALGFISTFLIGGLTGLFLGNVSVDIPLSNTYFVVAHFHMVMGVSPVLAVFGGLYHWYPKVTGRMFHEGLARLHFWITFLGAYAIFFPMHYLGLLGMPRRYYSYDNYSFIPASAQHLNAFITVAALVVGIAQLLFLFNLGWSAVRGRAAGANPWRAASLEWQTPHTPPGHGNWGPQLPVVYRGAYAYGRTGPEGDFLPQNVGPDEPDEDEVPGRVPASPGAPVAPGAGGAS